MNRSRRAAALIMIAAGCVGLFLPFLPGIILIAAGAALL